MKNISKLLKKTVKAFLYLFLLIIVLIVGVYLSAGLIVKKAVTLFVPEITGTSAEVRDVQISLLQGHIAVQGLKIGNLPNYQNPNLFELGTLDIHFDPKSVLTDKIIINSILIDKTAVSAEMSLKGDINLVQVNNNVQSYLNKGSTTKEVTTSQADSSKETDSSKKVIIQDLRINNSSLALGIGSTTTTLPLPNIHQKNIGEGKKKMTLKETVAVVLSYLTSESVKTTLSSGKEILMKSIGNIKDNVNNMAQQAKDQIGSQVESVKGQVDSLKGELNQATDKLKGLKDLF